MKSNDIRDDVDIFQRVIGRTFFGRWTWVQNKQETKKYSYVWNKCLTDGPNKSRKQRGKDMKFYAHMSDEVPDAFSR